MPTLLLDKTKCLANMEKMSRKAAGRQLSFRPHFKTHQSAEIGNWFRDFGVSKITVSSFRMASYFALSGWKDILVAFPFNPHDLDQLNTLSEIKRISILIDHPHALNCLDRLEHPVGYYIDIDTGYGRTGIKSEDAGGIERLLSAASTNNKLNFKGFYCHAGHSYKALDPVEKNAIHGKARQDLVALKKQFCALDPMVLYGDTPNCSIQEDFEGIDEITPGNFVFYDLTQAALGSCSLDEIAVALSCPVVSKYPDLRRILIHGGAVHFSKESLRIGNRVVYGEVAGNGWNPLSDETYVTGISQEHGILEGCESIYDQTAIGDMLYILPVHSCLTANLMKVYQTLEGELIQTINS
jgi:D-serine deaminase-like pyridoxal phosphate-dependent protein